MPLPSKPSLAAALALPTLLTLAAPAARAAIMIDDFTDGAGLPFVVNSNVGQSYLVDHSLPSVSGGGRDIGIFLQQLDVPGFDSITVDGFHPAAGPSFLDVDSTSGATVMGLLRRVVDGGQTVVMVTHDPSAAALADRVVFLRDGRIVGEVEGGDTDRVIDTFRGVEAGARSQAPA